MKITKKQLRKLIAEAFRMPLFDPVTPEEMQYLRLKSRLEAGLSDEDMDPERLAKLKMIGEVDPEHMTTLYQSLGSDEIDLDQMLKLGISSIKKGSDDFNYIPNLINWLGWEWDDNYLSPHKSKRNVFTASSSQVREKINSKSVGEWSNYEELLKPAIDILSANNFLI